MDRKPKSQARERRRDQRILDAGLGKKKTSDALLEEITEEAFDWLEQGGARRLWMILKVFVAVFLALVIMVLIYMFDLPS